MNIQDLSISLNQTLQTFFLLSVRQTWMTQLILAVSLWGYLPFIRKDSNIHMHCITVYVKEGLPSTRDVSLENSADSYLCFWLTLLHSVSYFFFLFRSPSLSFCTVFYSILSNVDEVVSINPSAHLLVFLFLETLTSIIRTGLPILVVCYNFSISNDLLENWSRNSSMKFAVVSINLLCDLAWDNIFMTRLVLLVTLWIFGMSYRHGNVGLLIIPLKPCLIV